MTANSLCDASLMMHREDVIRNLQPRVILSQV